MSAVAASFAGAPGAYANPTASLSRTADGWAIVGPDDAVVFAAAGPDARYLCLQHARDSGILRIDSHQ